MNKNYRDYIMEARLWRPVERFCRHHEFNPNVFSAFADLVEQDREETIRQKIKNWSSDALEQLSFLVSATIDTIDNPDGSDTVFQCQGLYLTGPQKSLLSLASKEIPKKLRDAMAIVSGRKIWEQQDIIVGSHIIPATWVHGFTWKQWRAGLARDAAMFQRPCKNQPKQAQEAQAWILPVFVQKESFSGLPVEEVPEQTAVSPMGQFLSVEIKSVFAQMYGVLPQDVWIHPILAAAHCCWSQAKMIAVYEWLKGIKARALTLGQSILIKEAPVRGSVQVREAHTGKLIAELLADPSFPVDGTSLAVDLSAGRRTGF
jgi:hypothetical protein